MEEKIKLLESNLKKCEEEQERENERKRKESTEQPGRGLKVQKRAEENRELEKMRRELGELGGAGHFWGDERVIGWGGVRNSMKEEDLKKVLRLISIGQKTVNLKEREFLAFFSAAKQKQPREVLCLG